MTEPYHVQPGLNIIYARSENRCIGAHGGLPWRLPLEYQHFETVTQGFPMIMGRRSYEDHDGLLPGGTNIIVSTQPNLNIESGAILASSLTQAIETAQQINPRYFVIGGAGLITEALLNASSVFETIVLAEIDGDTYLPEFDFSNWETRKLLAHPQDTEHVCAFHAYQHIRQKLD